MLCGTNDWLVVWGFKATLIAKVISRRLVTHVFPGFLTPVLTQLFFPKPPTTFLTCFCRGERRKYAGKKSRLNQGSNPEPPGHEFDTLTTEPPKRGVGPMICLYYMCVLGERQGGPSGHRDRKPKIYTGTDLEFQSHHTWWRFYIFLVPQARRYNLSKDSQVPFHHRLHLVQKDW